VVRAAQQEAHYWLSKSNLDQAPKEGKDGFETAMKSIDPYAAVGKFKPFKGDTELVPGVRAVAAPGHTPGHTLYRVESEGQNLLLWGDIMHVAAVQFPDPAVTIRYDKDSAAAAAQRKCLPMPP
jgi:glyoxylase-like metal-dependent hydrolase (beta-lactamase superfamily II)